MHTHEDFKLFFITLFHDMKQKCDDCKITVSFDTCEMFDCKNSDHGWMDRCNNANFRQKIQKSSFLQNQKTQSKLRQMHWMKMNEQHMM